MRRFVALVQEPSEAEVTKFREFLSSRGWGYWHWIEGSWLLTVDAGNVDRVPEKNVPKFVRDKLGEIAPGKHCLVFDFDNPKSWAGFGPNGTKMNMFSWFKESWIGQ